MWITVKTASELLGITERTVQKSCKNGKYEFRYVDGMGRGGKQYEVLLESLPKIAITRYYETLESYKKEKQSERPKGCSGKQWREAEIKAQIVLDYKASHLSVDEFIKQYNEINAPEKTLTRRKLFTYQRKYNNGGIEALIDSRGGANDGVQITEEIWEYFYSLYMTQQERTVRLCYDITKEKFSGKDVPFPSISSFERRVRQIDTYTLIKYRKGEHALKDLLPSMERDKSSINSNDIWFSDHHRIDVFVRNERGKIYRPWLTTFFDARSNRIVSFVVREADPNAFVIKQCLRLGIEENGLPKELYFDNGKDYRSQDFNIDFPLSITRQLGMHCIHATPYHGQAKTVERFFGIFESRFGKLFPTYTGKDNKNRPEKMRISNDKIAEIAPSTEEFTEAITAYIKKYNASPNGGEFMGGESPDVVYAKNLIEKVSVDKDDLAIMCATSVERTVHKNGVSLFNNNYYSIGMIPLFGRKVIVKYLPENIDKVYIFDMENNYICDALAKLITPYRNTSEEDYRRAAKEKQAVREHIKKYAPKGRELTIQEIIAINQSEEKELSEPITFAETKYVNPKAKKAMTEIGKERDTSIEKHRKNSISRTMNEYYEKIKKA